MKKALLSLMIAGLAAAAALAAVEQTVDRTVPVEPDVAVEIEIVSGEVRIDSWERAEVRIRGTLGEDIEEFRVEGRGSRLLIEVETPRGRFPRRRDVDANLQITVPVGAQLEVETVSAPIRVDGVGGSMELGSVSGGIEVSGAGSAAELETVSGSITFRGTGAGVSAESVSGRIRLEGVAGNVEAASVSGGVMVSAGEIRRGELESVSGSIDFEGSLGRSARVEVSSHSGNVTLRLPQSVSAEFEVSTFSGSIDNDFGPEGRRTSRWVPAKSLEFTAGAGDAQVTVETFSGNVRLLKR